MCVQFPKEGIVINDKKTKTNMCQAKNTQVILDMKEHISVPTIDEFLEFHIYGIQDFPEIMKSNS